MQEPLRTVPPVRGAVKEIPERRAGESEVDKAVWCVDSIYFRRSVPCRIHYLHVLPVGLR